MVLRHTGTERDLKVRQDALLRAAVRRLNALPADHPFWGGRPPRPTVHAASDYFPGLLVEHPSDDEARRVLAALSLHWCDNDFGRAYLEPLVARDPETELPWLVAGAIWVQQRSGVVTLPLLRDSLTRLRTGIGGFEERVGCLARAGDPTTSRMARVALAVLNDEPVDGLWY
jgi:hypothetical protein